MKEEEQQLLDLFDTFWFGQLVLSHTAPPSPPPVALLTDQSTLQAEKSPQISSLPSLHRRSLSHDHHLPASHPPPFSPSSDLQAARLQTILSGKESGTPAADAPLLQEPPREKPLCSSSMERTRRKKNRGCKSLSDLEYEELRGFLDLGFIFPEEEIDSRLISIVPGLQRRGKPGDAGITDESAVARPYLSEAWSFSKDTEDPLRMWRVPATGDGIKMKGNLLVWAHTVASSVR